jgi:hypothetical protein
MQGAALPSSGEAVASGLAAAVCRAYQRADAEHNTGGENATGVKMLATAQAFPADVTAVRS